MGLSLWITVVGGGEGQTPAGFNPLGQALPGCPTKPSLAPGQGNNLWGGISWELQQTDPSSAKTGGLGALDISRIPH